MIDKKLKKKEDKERELQQKPEPPAECLATSRSAKGDCTFFVAGVQLRFQIPIAKILFAALDDEGRVPRVARHAEDERLGL